MTRVNLVKPDTLADQHLFAEWREIKMVPAALRRSLRTKSVDSVLKSIPTRYTLNKGHVTFFYNKMRFLHQRFDDLTAELLLRDYNIKTHNPDDIFFKDIPDVFSEIDWAPVQSEVDVNIERINLRISERPGWYRHRGEII